MDAEETASSGQPPTQGGSRWKYIGMAGGAALVLATAFIFGWHALKAGDRLSFPTLVKARTNSVGAAGSNEPPPPIVIQLSPDMVRVTAIALGHPRLAVINGKAVTEGDNVKLQASNSSVALILRVVKIGDGSIEFSDGKQEFNAQLTIPSSPHPREF